MKFNFEATGIGSLPFTDVKEACRAVFDNFTDIPFWPQLPKLSYREHMYCQFSEGMPGVVIDEKKKQIHVDSGRSASGVENFYQKILDKDVEYFRISDGYAGGLYAFSDDFKRSAPKASFVKGHITGPVSFALSVTDENKKALIYDSGLFDIVIKALSMKARWQIRRLKKLKSDVIIFIDEPYLVSIGSSFINISSEDTVKALEEINSAIKEEGGLSGIHCCGNTDWGMVLERGIDIINFDAYNFMKEFLLYTDSIKKFLRNNGTLAWGIVPSSEALDKESVSDLVKKIEAGIRQLSDKGIDKKEISSIVTSSCGLGTLDGNKAKKAIELVNNLSRELKR